MHNATLSQASRLRDFPGEPAGAEAILSWAIERFYPRIGLTASFGGAAGVVLAHMIGRINKNVPIFVIDTGFLFKETYELIGRFETRYDLNIRPVRPVLSPAEQAVRYGAKLWQRDPDLCCELRKVQPMEAVLQNLDAWISGLRREQSDTRRDTGVIEEHMRDGRTLFKLNPLAGWSKKGVWDYIFEHDIPYNPLLDKGYKSIGCTHCTLATTDGNERSGRWAGHNKTECGLHTFTRRVT